MVGELLARLPGVTGVRRALERAMFPGSLRQASEEQVRAGLGPHDTLLTATTTRGEPVAVVHRAASTTGGDTGTATGGDDRHRHVLFLYGNGMALVDTPPVRRVLGSAGASVTCVDYVGYGASPGVPSEGGCYRAAHAALDVLADRYGVPADQVDLVGWSLGSAVALQVAAARPVRRLVLLSPFAGVASFVLAPVRLDGTPLRHLGPFAGGRRAAAITAAALLVCGEADRTTPPSMTHALARSLPGGAEVLLVPDTGHNDLFARPDVWKRVLAFLTRRHPVTTGAGVP